MDKKSPDAFRTISEVADWLGVPTHVLRFWESRFTQVKPVKRAGGRRYYRPADMELLGGIRKLLHEDGMTIRGVQKLLRENGVKHVAAMSPPLDSDDLRDPDGSNVVSLTPAPEREPQKPVHAPEPEALQPVEAPVEQDMSETSAPIQEDSQDSEPEATSVEHDQNVPPTLTDAPEEAEDRPASSSEPEQETSTDLFSERAEETPQDQGELVSETNVEPVDATPSEGLEEAEVPEADDTPLAASADTQTEISTPETPAAAPATIDVSHIASDIADDAFSASAKASVASKLRALQTSGGALPDGAVDGMIARLKDLATRMPPAPSDDGRAE